MIANNKIIAVWFIRNVIWSKSYQKLTSIPMLFSNTYIYESISIYETVIEYRLRGYVQLKLSLASFLYEICKCGV